MTIQNLKVVRLTPLLRSKLCPDSVYFLEQLRFLMDVTQASKTFTYSLEVRAFNATQLAVKRQRTFIVFNGRFEPARLNDQVVPVVMTVTVNFQLSK